MDNFLILPKESIEIKKIFSFFSGSLLDIYRRHLWFIYIYVILYEMRKRIFFLYVFPKAFQPAAGAGKTTRPAKSILFDSRSTKPNRNGRFALNACSEGVINGTTEIAGKKLFFFKFLF